jgi:2'-5' RNA ligase
MDMKTIVNTIPGYRVYEYLLVLNPHEELWNRIMKLKDEFADQFKNEAARKIRPQLSLVSFIQYGMMEDRIIGNLRTVAMGFPPFKVELKDFGSFPSHTIYINVTSKIPVQNLVRQVRTQTQRLMKLNEDNKPHFIMEPHLTIGRKLLPWQYEKAWLEYSNKHFTGRFIADSMSLIRRPAGELKFQVVERFAFQNLPVITKQGELFG